MIYRLRRNFILISAVLTMGVFSAIFAVTLLVGNIQLNSMMDELTDAIALNDGVFPEFDASARVPQSGARSYMEVITEETRFSTRFFVVWMDGDGSVVRVNVDSIFSISEEEAQRYAQSALADGKERGWVSDCRYKVFASSDGTAIVFVDGSMNHMQARRFWLIVMVVLEGSGLLIILLFVLISKRVVRPVAESYEKQKQFITDANHELKTPLTLILSNLDIVEGEVGKNEWLDDIRSEGERMGLLINQLVTLSRMDEDTPNLNLAEFDLSGAVSDTVSEFKALAQKRSKTLFAELAPSILYRGDEGLIRQLTSVLLDNAVKYCDAGGEIKVLLYEKRHPVLIVENTCQNVNNLELGRLCDRFYRADKARTFSGSFGVGLSIAKGIARRHHGDISLYKRERLIGFRVDLK